VFGFPRATSISSTVHLFGGRVFVGFPVHCKAVNTFTEGSQDTVHQCLPLDFKDLDFATLELLAAGIGQHLRNEYMAMHESRGVLDTIYSVRHDDFAWPFMGRIKLKAFILDHSSIANIKDA